MWTHLNRHHFEEVHAKVKCEDSSTPCVSVSGLSAAEPPLPSLDIDRHQPTTTGTTTRQIGAKLHQPSVASFLETRKPYPMGGRRVREINQALAEFVASDMRPLSVVEGAGFKNLLHTLDSRYEPISRNTLLEKYIVPMYQVTTQVVKEDIAKAEAHSFTTDAWSSSAMQSYVTTTVHYIDPSTFELKCNVLDTHQISGSHTGARLASEMQATQVKWGLKNVKGVSDNAANVQSALNIYDVPHFGCFAHTINLSVSKGLDDPAMKKLLGRVRALVSTFKQSYLRTEQLHINEKLVGLKNLQLIQDVATRWNSQYYMIDRLLAVYPAVYSSLYGGSHEHLLLSDEDRKVLEEMQMILKVFEKATKKVSAEKEPTAGLILPYLEAFVNRDLVYKDTDLPIIKRLKTQIRSDLNKRYQTVKEKSLLGLTSVLDPRVRTLDWMSEEDKEAIYSSLKEECIACAPLNQPLKIKAQPTDDNPVPSTSTASSPSPAKKRRTDDSESDDDLDGVVFVNAEGPKTTEARVIDELASYRQEPSLGVKYGDPLIWWKAHRLKYPILAAVMRQYLNIPASSVPSERVFSTAGGVFRKRESLVPENANILVFLYQNYEKYKSVVLPRWRHIVS
ncbi:PREDICTED: zinc finger BED domain-containing protein 4-like [Priapulus caudatus]|uniref:Zinc finger BED domain-containing protein 4-like n=1 Tax=Priapulus caudatus TaxID=37621 RepID=A0ABM1F6H9_PRICU|nr:PREDICTED: zinc finger BED domain-containing protein 4-like [Priapulus caudatus]